jgi:hypothetical protein
MGPRKAVCDKCGKQLINKNNELPVGDLNKVIEAYNDGKDLEDIESIIEEIKIEQEKRQVILTKRAEIDWHTLERGDVIKVSKMDGSSWVTGEGEEIPMGDNGNFKVLSHDANGIHAWGLGKKSGHYYLWMTDEIKTASGLTRKPHKILKLKKFVKKDDSDE